jgi:NAD(P)-dependent dehydrogenase (short-subunit alcohol dehydrogenase family)
MNLRRTLDSALDATLLGYTRIGHALRRGAYEGLPSMAGVTAVVTGATGGIGRAAAERMARLGAGVVVVGRDPEKVSAATFAIGASGGDAAGEVADLSLMADVEALAGRLLSRFGHIDVLVNNVGVLLPERTVTAEGLEATFATNLLGQFVLTGLLVPRLAESSPARVVNVSSGGMYAVRISSDLETLRGGYDGRTAYARTKRGQVILTEIWADRLRDLGVVAHAMHPGWVDTPGVRSGIPLFHTVTRPLLRSADQGADTIVWLAASRDAAATTGSFWHDRRPRPTHRLERTRETPEERVAFWRRLHDYAGWQDPLG